MEDDRKYIMVWQSEVGFHYRIDPKTPEDILDRVRGEAEKWCMELIDEARKKQAADPGGT